MKKAMLFFAILVFSTSIVLAAPAPQPYCLDYERSNNPSTIGLALYRSAESGWKLGMFSDTCQNPAAVVQGVCRGKVFEKSTTPCPAGAACLKGICVGAAELLPILEAVDADEKIAGFCADNFPAGANEPEQPEQEQAAACALDSFPTKELAAHLKQRTEAMSADEKQTLSSSLGFEGGACSQQLPSQQPGMARGQGGPGGQDGGCFISEQMKTQLTPEQVREFEQRCKQQADPRDPHQIIKPEGTPGREMVPEMQGLSEEQRKAMLFGKGTPPSFQQGMSTDQMQKIREQVGAPLPSMQRGMAGGREASGREMAEGMGSRGIGSMDYCALDERMKQAMTPDQLSQWQARCGQPGMKITGFFSRFGNYFRK